MIYNDEFNILNIKNNVLNNRVNNEKNHICKKILLFYRNIERN